MAGMQKQELREAKGEPTGHRPPAWRVIVDPDFYFPIYWNGLVARFDRPGGWTMPTGWNWSWHWIPKEGILMKRTTTGGGGGKDE